MEVTKFKTERDKGLMVRMSPDEALRLIISLSNQIADKDCNSHRAEFYTKDGEYFSIAVHQPNP